MLMGRMLVVLGIVIAGIGLVLMFSDKIPLLGRLPGDITIKRDNVRIFFPITSSTLVSVLVSIMLWIFSHFKGK